MKIIKSRPGRKTEELAAYADGVRESLGRAAPRGACAEVVKGHQYCYLIMREGSKVRFEYKGKLFGKEIAHFDEIKEDRAKYRRLLTDVKKQIAFLRRTLKGKELREVS